MNCPICSGRKQSSLKLCPDHHKALKGIIESYEVWNKAYDGIKKKEYLREIINRSETGKLAIAVAQFLLDGEDNMILWNIVR